MGPHSLGPLFVYCICKMLRMQNFVYDLFIYLYLAENRKEVTLP